MIWLKAINILLFPITGDACRAKTQQSTKRSIILRASSGVWESEGAFIMIAYQRSISTGLFKLKLLYIQFFYLR